MPHWYADPNCDPTCKAWVEAVLCSGYEPPAWRLFAYQGDLPETAGVYLYQDRCWQVNPSAERICLPRTPTHRLWPATRYGSCAACDDRDPEDESSPGGLTPPGGWGDPSGGMWGPGGGSGGGGGGGGGEPYTGTWRQASPCPAHTGRAAVQNVYVRSDQVTAERFFRYNAICYVVSPSSPEVSQVPEGGRGLQVSGTFTGCDQCTHGVKAELCPEYAEFEGVAPVIYVSVLALPTEICTFRDGPGGRYCYRLDPQGAQVLIPVGAKILQYVTNQFADCTACGKGRQAQLCPDQVDPGYEVWVPEADVPQTHEIIWRYEGKCWRVIPGAVQAMPPGVRVVIPPSTTQYADCPECLCGLSTVTPPRGAKVGLCGGQNVRGAKDWWVKESDIPDEFSIWREGTVCVYAGPGMPVVDLPPEAILVKPKQNYSSCNACTGAGGGGDGDGDGDDGGDDWDEDGGDDGEDGEDGGLPSGGGEEDEEDIPEWFRVRRLYECQSQAPVNAFAWASLALGQYGWVIKPNYWIGPLDSSKCYYQSGPIYDLRNLSGTFIWPGQYEVRWTCEHPDCAEVPWECIACGEEQPPCQWHLHSDEWGDTYGEYQFSSWEQDEGFSTHLWLEPDGPVVSCRDGVITSVTCFGYEATEKNVSCSGGKVTGTAKWTEEGGYLEVTFG